MNAQMVTEFTGTGKRVESELPRQTEGEQALLRRAGWARHLRWFGAEFLVVVTGVLVALAVQAWYQGRNDGRREREYLRQLLSDLRETERIMLSADSLNRHGDHSGASLVRAFNNPASARDSVLKWLAEMGGITYRLPVTGTAEALIASGDLALIRNDSLRAAVPGYVSSSRSLTDLYTQATDRWYRLRGQLRLSVEPFDAAALAALPRRAGDVRGNPLFDPHPHGTTRVAFPLSMETFLTDRGAYAALSEMNTARSMLWIIRREMRQEAKSLRAHVESELSR